MKDETKKTRKGLTDRQKQGVQVDALVRRRPLRVLSLGAGVQSSTLALMCAHGEFEMPDCAIFADTQAEPQSVYDWLAWLEDQLPFPVHRVTAGDLAKKSLVVKTSRNNRQYAKHAIPAFIVDNENRVGIMMRQCTSDFKIEVIQRKIKQLSGGNSVEQYIGISWDEIHRIKDSRKKYIVNRYPLIEKRIRRIDCLRWMQENGYPEPPRSACMFCPYHSDKEWLRLKTEEPLAFQQAVEFEKNYQKTYSQIYNFRGTPFLHRSLKPLSEVDFDPQKNQMEMDFFGNECEGMCGV